MATSRNLQDASNLGRGAETIDALSCPGASAASSLRIAWKRMMRMAGRDCGVPGSDRDLVQIGDDIPDGIKAGHGGLLMLIDDQAARVSSGRPQLRSQLRAHLTAKNGVERIERQLFAIREPHGEATRIVLD